MTRRGLGMEVGNLMLYFNLFETLSLRFITLVGEAFSTVLKRMITPSMFHDIKYLRHNQMNKAHTSMDAQRAFFHVNDTVSSTSTHTLPVHLARAANSTINKGDINQNLVDTDTENKMIVLGVTLFFVISFVLCLLVGGLYYYYNYYRPRQHVVWLSRGRPLSSRGLGRSNKVGVNASKNSNNKTGTGFGIENVHAKSKGPSDHQENSSSFLMSTWFSGKHTKPTHEGEGGKDAKSGDNRGMLKDSDEQPSIKSLVQMTASYFKKSFALGSFKVSEGSKNGSNTNSSTSQSAHSHSISSSSSSLASSSSSNSPPTSASSSASSPSSTSAFTLPLNLTPEQQEVLRAHANSTVTENPLYSGTLGGNGNATKLKDPVVILAEFAHEMRMNDLIALGRETKKHKDISDITEEDEDGVGALGSNNNNSFSPSHTYSKNADGRRLSTRAGSSTKLSMKRMSQAVFKRGSVGGGGATSSGSGSSSSKGLDGSISSPLANHRRSSTGFVDFGSPATPLAPIVESHKEDEGGDEGANASASADEWGLRKSRVSISMLNSRSRGNSGDVDDDIEAGFDIENPLHDPSQQGSSAKRKSTNTLFPPPPQTSSPSSSPSALASKTDASSDDSASSPAQRRISLNVGEAAAKARRASTELRQQAKLKKNEVSPPSNTPAAAIAIAKPVAVIPNKAAFSPLVKNTRLLVEDDVFASSNLSITSAHTPSPPPASSSTPPSPLSPPPSSLDVEPTASSEDDTTSHSNADINLEPNPNPNPNPKPNLEPPEDENHLQKS